jgi:hypothetical protein
MADKGLPEIDRFGFVKFFPGLVLGPVVWSSICAPAAWYIYTKGNTELFDRNIARLAESEQGYTYLAAALFNLAVVWINSYPMLYKTMVMRFGSGNVTPA